MFKEHISCLVLVFLLLNLNMSLPAGIARLFSDWREFCVTFSGLNFTLGNAEIQ